MLSRVEPPAVNMLEPTVDPNKAESLMVTVIDQMATDAVEELKQLRAEIDAMIAALGTDATNVKNYLGRYFALRAEALDFRNQIRERLLEITNMEKKST